jgi:hypothetical protein
VDTTSDPSACGFCGATCPVRLHAERTCVAGRCGFRCLPGAGDCNGLEADGCEADLRGDPTRCGDCTTTCPAPPRMRPTCVDGRCGAACVDGYGDCNGRVDDGCETSLASSLAHCGGCGHACTGNERCVAGTCLCVAPETTRCAGRCTDVTIDPAHCGRCETACAMGMVCVAGACSACPAGRASCAGSCVDLLSDPRNCGACSRTCMRWCVSGSCWCWMDGDCGAGQVCVGSACVAGSRDAGAD